METRQALQWWCRRQTLRSYHEAEQIRDGLLQESFSLWRALEVSLAHPDAKPNQEWQKQLELTERLHVALQQMSDRLSPPYSDDNMILALQYAIEMYRKQHPNLQLTLDLPVNWQAESYETIRTVLMTLDELLRIALAQTRFEPPTIAIALRPLPGLGELVVQFTDPTQSLSPLQVKEFAYLRRAFQILTSGKCFYRCKDASITWHFRWASQLA